MPNEHLSREQILHRCRLAEGWLRGINMDNIPSFQDESTIRLSIAQIASVVKALEQEKQKCDTTSG